jgi:hypothetical protein
MSNNSTKKADHLSLFRVCTMPSRRPTDIRKMELMGRDAGAGWRVWPKRRREWNTVQERLAREARRSASYRDHE